MAAARFHHNFKLRLTVWCEDCYDCLLVPMARINISFKQSVVEFNKVKMAV